MGLGQYRPFKDNACAVRPGIKVTWSNRIIFFEMWGQLEQRALFFSQCEPGENHKGLLKKGLEINIIRNSHELGTLLNAGFVENVAFGPYHEVELWWRIFFPLSESTMIVV